MGGDFLPRQKRNSVSLADLFEVGVMAGGVVIRDREEI
jgi:hypothetical protein